MHLIGVIERSSNDHTLMLSKPEPSVPWFFLRSERAWQGGEKLLASGTAALLSGSRGHETGAPRAGEKAAAIVAGAPWLWLAAFRWACPVCLRKMLRSKAELERVMIF